MNHEEFTKLCDEMRAQGMKDEDILGTILQMFKDGKITVDDMKKMAGALGYELTEEFLRLTKGMDRMPSPESTEDKDGGELSEEEVKDAQEYKPEEDSDEDEDESDDDEEYEEKEEDEESESEDEYEDDDEEEEESEEDEKKKVREMYGE